MSLNVSNLTVHHGAICAVNQVSLAVPTGKLAAIIGANGAGKTTLLRALSGLNKPTSGVVNWMGQTITAEKPEKLVRMGISHVSEGKSVIPELTVKENLELGAIWRKNGKEMNLDDYTKLMYDQFSHLNLLESEKVLDTIKDLKQESGPFDDDFSLVEIIINS